MSEAIHTRNTLVKGSVATLHLVNGKTIRIAVVYSDTVGLAGEYIGDVSPMGRLIYDGTANPSTSLYPWSSLDSIEFGAQDDEDSE